MIESRVKTLKECILEIDARKIESNKDGYRAGYQTSLVDIYSLPFSTESKKKRYLIEDLFQFTETFLGEEWENYKTQKVGKNKYYSILPSEVLVPVPQTIDDFINDCIRVWGIDLVWEDYLIKTAFNDLVGEHIF